MRALGLILPLIARDGLPYVEDRGSYLLVDSGSSMSYVARRLLQSDASAAGALARSVDAAAVEDVGLQLPAGVHGILGFDALCAGGSFEVDVDGGALRLDEPPAFDGAHLATMRAATLGSSRRPYPLVDVEVFGAGAARCTGLVDTGSPVTIANGALAAAAGLLDALDDDAAATRGATGATTALRPCTAAGVVFGSARRPACKILVGDLPQWAALDLQETPAVLLGLDLLGRRLRGARAAPPRKKSRGDEPARRRKSRGAAVPAAGDAWELTVPA